MPCSSVSIVNFEQVNAYWVFQFQRLKSEDDDETMLKYIKEDTHLVGSQNFSKN